MTRKEFKTLVSGRILKLDGAMGTELAKRGMPPGAAPEAWALEHEAEVIAVQRAYAEAGADILYVPSFGGNRVKLAKFKLADRLYEINRQLAELSRKAAPDKLIFGDISSTGLLIEPYGELEFETAVDIYREQAQSLADANVDGLVIETLMDLQEARAALLGVREAAPDLPVIVTLTFEPDGRTLTGCDPVSALVTLQALGADAFGCNCSSGPEEMAELIKKMYPFSEIPLVAKPNAGMPHLENGRTVFDLEVHDFAKLAADLADAGASLIGGCCGTTPEHIRALSGEIAFRKSNPKAPACPDGCGAISGTAKLHRFSTAGKFTIIGERINPTGKKALQQHLREGKLDMVLQMAREQSEAGASVLDVNLGLAGIDESALMQEAVRRICRSVDLPLSIDSTDACTVEKALRLYPGRALLNSISAEHYRLEKLLPIAKKYGAMLILLPLDDNGLPQNAAERMTLLEKLLEHCRKAGFRQNDLVVDALVTTISTDETAGREIMQFIRQVNQEKKLPTTCGLSNISFGLPDRGTVNAAFLLMASACGLNCAIANPMMPLLMESLGCANALLGYDEHLKDFLAGHTANSGTAPVPAEKSAARPLDEQLFQAILNGDGDAALRLSTELLAAGISEEEQVNRILIPSITEVGCKFEKKEFYLPQLMQSANAMQQVMTHLEPGLAKNRTQSSGPKPVFVLATVEGDIHDIGKNIVKLLLENHGFEVQDLGCDVPAAEILAAVRKFRPCAVGLSALMTTTMPKMAETIDLLRANGENLPVITGGAAVDEHFARSIGAVYADDAMATVRLAQQSR